MKKYLSGFMVLSACSLFSQQDTQYGLYQFNQMVVNPAYTGSRDAIAVVADARNQWTGLDGAPKTLVLSVHSPLQSKKIGVGINVLSDRIGAKSVNAFYGNFAYILKLNNSLKLSFGARVGYMNYKFNYNDVKYKDQNEPVVGDLANTNRGALDMDAGVYLKGNSFYIGLSVAHLNSGRLYNKTFQATDTIGVLSDYSLSYNLQPHSFLVVGKSFMISDNFMFSPSIMLKAVKGSATFDINLNTLIKKRLWAGVFFRRGYGFGALLQVIATDQLRIGYAYDIGVKDRRTLGGAHEIMIGYDIRRGKSKAVSPRFL
ncbi:MAG: PorP/SprF family type IX secretion system membrane protein [Bacteroidia bacterium]